MSTSTSICLGLGENGHEAAEFYVSLLPNSRIVNRFTPPGYTRPLVIDIVLNGLPVQVFTMDFGKDINERTSLSVSVDSQAETDRLWDALLSDGGAELNCGWVKDRFGLHWQITPENLPRRLQDPDREAAGRAMQAMLGMTKIDMAAIERAFKGDK